MLAAELDRYAAWGEARGVPLYLGEFGAIRASFERGGLSWVTDMLDLLAERDMAWTYHSYRESAFGLYWDDYPTPPNPANANTALIELFTERLAP
jgi:endoglucanase